MDQVHEGSPWTWGPRSVVSRKYKAEYLKTGRKQISETKFCQGHNAGNFKEMAQMVDLLTFVMRLENLDDIISQFSTAVSDKLHSEEVKEEFR
jgi:siroheme synthase